MEKIIRSSDKKGNNITDQEREISERSIEKSATDIYPPPPEVIETLNKVYKMIELAKKVNYIISSNNLKHYLEGNGRPKTFQASILRSEIFIKDHLYEVHLPRIVLGIQKRINNGTLKIGGPSDHLRWSDWVSPPTDSDLFYAFGGIPIESKIIVSAIQDLGKGDILVRFDRWVVKCQDKYDWSKILKTFVQWFGDIDEEDLKTLNDLGYAKNYIIKFKSFSALELLGISEINVSTR